MKYTDTRTMHHKATCTVRWRHLIVICMMSSFVISCLDDKDRCPDGMVLIKKEASADDINWFDVCIVPPDTGTGTGNGDGTDTGTGTQAIDTGTGTEAAPCTAGSCVNGEYCDLTINPPTCLPPPAGQGQTCAVPADCAGFEANYCENALTFTCLIQHCDIAANNCSEGYMCCDFTWAGLPTTCVSKAYWGNTCYVPSGK